MPSTLESFARHGSEKMLYDVRMGPQCVYAGGAHYFAYQANAAGGKARPYIIRRSADGVWGEPVDLGDVTHYDHHFAPVLWIDATQHIHVLYHCHIYEDESRHLVSERPLDITAWREAPQVAPSISYPRVIPLPGGRLLLFYRALGHMGFWTYRISDDGGFTWNQPVEALVDFDHRPTISGDDWAGSYHSAIPSADGRSLHLGFVDWDERNWPHPIYGSPPGNRDRRHLFYTRLDIESGQLFNIDGDLLSLPLNRRAAAACRVWDTGDRLTNQPAIALDENDSPCFILPVTEDRIDQCRFWFIRRDGQAWRRTPICATNDIWNAARLTRDGDSWVAELVVNTASRILPFGGGALQRWRSTDCGETWILERDLTPEPGMLCNNPQSVFNVDGSARPGELAFFAWPGPDCINQTLDGGLASGPFTGQAYFLAESV